MIGFNAGPVDWSDKRWNEIKQVIDYDFIANDLPEIGAIMNKVQNNYIMLINHIQNLEETGQGMSDALGSNDELTDYQIKAYEDIALAAKEDWDKLMENPNYLDEI